MCFSALTNTNYAEHNEYGSGQHINDSIWWRSQSRRRIRSIASQAPNRQGKRRRESELLHTDLDDMFCSTGKQVAITKSKFLPASVSSSLGIHKSFVTSYMIVGSQV